MLKYPRAYEIVGCSDVFFGSGRCGHVVVVAVACPVRVVCVVSRACVPVRICLVVSLCRAKVRFRAYAVLVGLARGGRSCCSDDVGFGDCLCVLLFSVLTALRFSLVHRFVFSCSFS